MNDEEKLFKNFFERAYKEERLDFNELQLKKNRPTGWPTKIAASIVLLLLAGLTLFLNIEENTMAGNHELEEMKELEFTTFYKPLSEWEPVTDDLLNDLEL